MLIVALINSFWCEAGISTTGQTRLVTIEGHLNAVTDQDAILQPVVMPYLQSPYPPR